MKIHLLILMLIAVVLSDPLQTIYNTINMPQGTKIQRVTKLQQITFTHSLAQSPTTWLQYAGLTTTLKVPFDQFVPVYYVILMNSANICWLSIRVMLDNKQVKIMASASHNVITHDHKGFAEIFLSKGDHFIRIDYTTDCNFNKITYNEWSSIALRADYLQVEGQKN